MKYDACLHIPLIGTSVKEAESLVADLIEGEVFGEDSEVCGLQLDLYMEDLVSARDAISSGVLNRYMMAGFYGNESRPVWLRIYTEGIPPIDREPFLKELIEQGLVGAESRVGVGYEWHYCLYLSGLGRLSQLYSALREKEQSYQAPIDVSEAVSEAVANCGGVPETMELAAHVPDASKADIDEAFEALDRLRVAHAELQLADAKHDRLSRLHKECDDDDLDDLVSAAFSDLVDAERVFIEGASTLIPLRVYNTLFKGLRGLK